MFTLSVHHVYTECIVRLHWVYSMFTLSVQHVYTECIVRLHWVYSMFTLSVWYVYIECIVRLHWVYSMFTLSVHVQSITWYKSHLWNTSNSHLFRWIGLGSFSAQWFIQRTFKLIAWSTWHRPRKAKSVSLLGIFSGNYWIILDWWQQSC